MQTFWLRSVVDLMPFLRWSLALTEVAGLCFEAFFLRHFCSISIIDLMPFLSWSLAQKFAGLSFEAFLVRELCCISIINLMPLWRWSLAKKLLVHIWRHFAWGTFVDWVLIFYLWFAVRDMDLSRSCQPVAYANCVVSGLKFVQGQLKLHCQRLGFLS